MKQIVIGALLMAFAVALGAFGAHALKMLIDEDALKVFETGIRYHFYHALGILFCGLLNEITKSAVFKIASIFFISGIILFSGSLYILSFKEFSESLRMIGFITPLGGICFIIGWLLVAYNGFKLTQAK